MTSTSVLFFNLTSEESGIIRDLLSQFEVDVPSREVSRFEDAETFLREEIARMVVFRVDAGLQRPDQLIRRFKRALRIPAPLLVLIPRELARKVKEYLQAGADDYWVLPLDYESFAPRLYVMLEWGQAVGRAGVVHTPDMAATLQDGGKSVWSGIRRRIRRALRPLRSGSGAAEAVHDPTAAIAGKWERVRRLGIGSFGEVWLVREKDGENHAVAKIPLSKKMNTRFLREAAILKRLIGHPNAVQLIEIVKEDEKAILIQEYVEGRMLQELLDHGLDSVSKEKAFRELLDVVAFAHRNRIMHRDIKPENIIITPSGDVKLLDFGTGKDLSRRSISNTIIGSRPYMAPEQIMGESRLAGDVWALGVILYAFATECLPFYDDNEKQLMDLILEVNPERPRNLAPELPEALESIILRCLEKDWTRRYRDATEVQADLFRTFPEFGAGEIIP